MLHNTKLKVRDNPKISDDGGGRDTQNLKEEVDGLIPSCEISSLLDQKNLLDSQLPPVIWRSLACRPYV